MKQRTQEDPQSRRSEEIQAIIDRMPTGWVGWTAALISIVMATVVALGFVISYPDTVDGRISVTAKIAPVRLVTNQSGRISLLSDNASPILAGDILACIENGASLKDVLTLDSLLSSGVLFCPPDTLLLGDLNSVYLSFSESSLKYRMTLESDLYSAMKAELENTVASERQLLDNLEDVLSLKDSIAKYEVDRLSKDSLLVLVGGMSRKDYESEINSHRATCESLKRCSSDILSCKADINKNLCEIRRIEIERFESLKESESQYLSTRNALISSLQQWKEKNVIISPSDGTLEYLSFIRDNDFVNSGAELFCVIPEKNEILGEVMIPSEGAGKVMLGQKANVKLSSFPYDEYGFLIGEVESISRMKNVIASSAGEGNIEAFRVVISFPDGLTSNYGRTLPLDFESSGMVEIITSQKKLIHRLFDNLKSKGFK